MTRTERKLLARTLPLGVLLTLAVVAADAGGMLLPLEHALYDRRARDCQFFAPPPTDKLVHLDIDDPSLEVIGKWPWPRRVYAELVDEIYTAGARALAFDVIFPEADEAAANAGPVAPGPSTRPVGADAEFADALRRFGNALIPSSFSPKDPGGPAAGARRAAAAALVEDLQLSQDDLNARFRVRSLPDVSGDDYLEALRTAMAMRIRRATLAGARGLDDLRQALLPGLDPSITSSIQVRAMEREFARQEALASLARLGRPLTPGLPPLLDEESKIPPIPALTSAARSTGFVDDAQIEDGVIRSVPLWVRSDDRLYPLLGLGLACSYLGVDPSAVRITPDAVVVPRPGRADCVIPVWTYPSSAHGPIGTFMDVPWFGRSDEDGWKTMYDYPAHRSIRQHMPMTLVWDPRETRRRIANNNRYADEALGGAISQVPHDDTPALTEYAAHPPPAADPTARVPVMDAVLAFLEPLARQIESSPTPPGRDEEARREEQELLREYQAIKTLRAQAGLLAAQLAAQRAALREALSGKAVLVGSTGSGAADFRTTPLHPQCPGVVVHGAVFNAVVSGFVLHHAPRWATWAITLAVGLLATAAASLLSPWKALPAAAGLVCGYFALNGLVLYDYAHWIVGAAGPLTATAAVWTALTIARFVVEKAERARIVQRFSSYVDPALVNYVIENPNKIRLEGQVKDLTVVFTDLAGFTTVTEKLQERTVDLLNEYLQVMTTVIRKHGGYVNKFLGDGIMFFYGAPRDNPAHAADAVATVLEMHQALVPFNEGLLKKGLPTIGMRAGVSTGTMVVGDAGGAQACDYTVLGDNVNLAARLESANKQFGSRILVSHETASRLDGQFLLRPIGRIQVKGKTQAVMTFEPLARTPDATAKDREVVARTTAVFDSYIAGDFEGCLTALEPLEAVAGASKLTNTYRKLCQSYLHAPAAAFDGSIVLTEK